MDYELEDSEHPSDLLLKRPRDGKSASPSVANSGSADVEGRSTPGAKSKPSKKRKKPATLANGLTSNLTGSVPKQKMSRLKVTEPSVDEILPGEDASVKEAAESTIGKAANSGAAKEKKAAPKRIPLGAVLVPSDVDRNFEVTRLLKPARSVYAHLWTARELHLPLQYSSVLELCFVVRLSSSRQ